MQIKKIGSQVEQTSVRFNCFHFSSMLSIRLNNLNFEKSLTRYKTICDFVVMYKKDSIDRIVI